MSKRLAPKDQGEDWGVIFADSPAQSITDSVNEILGAVTLDVEGWDPSIGFARERWLRAS